MAQAKKVYTSAYLTFSCKPWYEIIPQLRSVLELHHWFLLEDGKSIQRCDDQQSLRTFCVGFDNPRSLWEWLVASHQKRVLRSCGRVVRSLRRRGPKAAHLAKGLALGPPPTDGVFLLNGHRRLFESVGTDEDLRIACLASGLSIWLETPRQTVCASDPCFKCTCDQAWPSRPSRPHILWCCPATEKARQHFQAPRPR